MWDSFSGKELRRFARHDALVTSVSFSSDGTRLASGSFDHSVRLWDVASGQELRRFQHAAAVQSVVFDRDGRHLASGCRDGTVVLWHVESGSCLVTLYTAKEGWVAFLPDGRYKLVGNLAGEFWHVIGLCRYEVGELDDIFPDLRLPLDATMISHLQA